MHPAEIAHHFPQLEILELIGHGGMGMVYKARQPQLNRIVALKILSPTLSGDPAFAERFSREAQSMARLNHSNIVAVYDFGQSGGFYYFLMEYVDGESLHTLIHEERPDAEKARRIVAEICLGLQFAHEEGVIHRDIKPSNILLDKKGRIKIADFGLAKLGGANVGGPALTTVVMGTPNYMAPEQIETPATVDHRADIYSLGVVYYEMLTGGLPLGRFDPPSRKLVGLNARVDEVVLRALEKDPANRYQSADELRLAMESSVAPIQYEPPPMPAASSASPQSWGWLRQVLLMTGTALLAVLLYVGIKGRSPAPRPHGNPGPSVEVDFTGNQEGPLFGRRIIAPLELTKTQVTDVDKVIRRTQRDFVTLERRHTTRRTDKAGHVHITTEPFPDEAQQLMDNLWKELSAVLTPQQLATAHTLDFARFFPTTGKETVKVELWRDANGEEHFVESSDPGSTNSPFRNRSPGTMPPRYRFYLPQKGEPK